MDVDTIQKGTGDAAEIVSYLQRCAAAFLLGMAIKSAGTTMQYRLQTFTFDYEINLLETTGYYQSDPKTLGGYTQKTRFDRKLTVMELAKQIVCSKNILLNWEMDVWIPKLKHLRRLNDILEIPYEFLSEAISKRFALNVNEKNRLFKFSNIKNQIIEYIENSQKGDLGDRKEKFPDYNLGLLLRIFRLSLINTHKEFAKILNVNPLTIFKWERGRNKPNSKIPEKILSIKP